MLSIYYTLSDFLKNYKTEFYNTYFQEYSYYSYLIAYHKNYTNFSLKPPYQVLILEEKIIDDLLEKNSYQTLEIDFFDPDLFDYGERTEDGITILNDKKYLEEVFTDDFDNEVFQFYSIKTATSILNDIKNNYIDFDKYDGGGTENPKLLELEKQINSEDDEERYNLLEIEYDKTEESESLKKSLWQQKIELKYYLIDLVNEQYIPEFKNILSTIDKEIELEVERKKSNHTSKIKEEPKPLTTIQVQNDTDESKQETFTRPQKIKLLYELGIHDMMNKKHKFTNFQTEKILSDIFDCTDKTITNNFKNKLHTEKVKEYIETIKKLPAKR